MMNSMWKVKHNLLKIESLKQQISEGRSTLQALINTDILPNKASVIVSRNLIFNKSRPSERHLF